MKRFTITRVPNEPTEFNLTERKIAFIANGQLNESVRLLPDHLAGKSLTGYTYASHFCIFDPRETMNPLKAEVIAIGDEMTSGQRLDTNTQWLSQQLGELGVKIGFHSTVGDTLQDNLDVFRIAGERADIVVMTGGLGPTADDLTREALATVTENDLELHPEILAHIQSLYAKFKREMPERNKIQAYFPKGSNIIPNPEGTAPGIDLTWQATPEHQTRFFCLPGVPAEMIQMWHQTVCSEVQRMTGSDSLIHHHVMHCFGTGESRMEELLGDLTQRGRDPIVGITASRATISLRISTRAANLETCQSKLEPTIEEVNRRLGVMVFGTNGTTLSDVVLELLADKDKSLSILDCGLGGAVGWSLFETVHLEDDYLDRIRRLKGASTSHLHGRDLGSLVNEDQQQLETDIAIGIGPIETKDNAASFEVILKSEQTELKETFNYAGHSDFRHLRSVKQVLNFLRLFLLDL